MLVQNTRLNLSLPEAISISKPLISLLSTIFKIYIYYASIKITQLGVHKYLALRSMSKDWLTRNQDNVSEWSSMLIRRLLFQWTSTIKLTILRYTKITHLIKTFKFERTSENTHETMFFFPSWLIIAYSQASKQYLSYFQDENKFINIWKCRALKVIKKWGKDRKTRTTTIDGQKNGGLFRDYDYRRPVAKTWWIV